MSETKADKALGYFFKGYNCAQAVFTAFHEEMGMDESLALRLSSSMGGGMGGMREVCGAVSSMFLVLGAMRGYEDPEDMEQKSQHYALIRRMGERFKAEYGTIICRDLLAQSGIAAIPAPAVRTPEYYKSRPCAKYVAACASIVEEELHSK